MPAPVLTAQEIAQLTKEAARQQSFADALAAAVPAKTARAAELAVADGAFKKFFDYYNTDIIGKYDAERKAISGLYIPLPIVEADIIGPASIDGSVRTTPSLPATDIIRIVQFDGGGTSTTTVNEQQAITDQIPIEGYLVSGYTPQPTLNVTTKTASILTSASTSLMITDASSSPAFSVGQFFVVYSATDSALIKITSVTPGVGSPPPYTFTLGIEVIIPPDGSLAITSDCDTFSGFDDTERTNKIPTDLWMQNIMDFLVAALQAQINLRLLRLNEQLAAIAANLDPDGTAQLTTASLNANTSKTFLTNYLVTTDVSNTGLGTLSTERGVRTPFLVTRLSQIAANYTGQTENYYNRRYSIANDRANTSRGTLRLQIATQQSTATLTTYAASSEDAAGAINALLNP